MSVPKLSSFSLALCLALLTASPAKAQSDTGPQAAWRATSRLGYGPSPATDQAAQAGAKAWGLLQIDAAFAAPDCC